MAEPGTKYQYSNTGLQQVLPLLVEHVSGMSYPAYVQKNILNPLGMTSTGFEASDFEGRLARPYERVRGKMRALPRHGWKESGPMRSTASDLARFLIAHLNQGRIGHVQLLEPESVELMHARFSPLDWPAFFGLRWKGYALGWEVYFDDYEGHPGACPGYMGNLVMRSQAEGGIGIVLLVNRGASIDSVEWAEETYAPILQTLLDEADRLRART
jgi:CubicO group peptidase (beta-lactamase class C family)